MQIEHNSRERFYRKPFGAVTCGTRIRLRIAVSGVGIPNAVRLVYHLDSEKEEHRIDMPFLFSLGNNSIYSVYLDAPEKEDLIWYYVELDTQQGIAYYGNNVRQMGGSGRAVFP